MQPDQQPISPLAPHMQAPAPLNPIAQIECWYLPEGKHTIFNYRKSLIVLYPGWLVAYQASDHTELARIPLGPDLKMKYFLGFARFAQLNGKKYNFFTFSNLFLTTPMWAYGIFASTVLITTALDIGRLGTDDSNMFVQALRLIFLLAGFGILAIGMPKAKALVEACNRAAGIAQ